MSFPEAWQRMPAVRDGRVYALNANDYVSRPAGRLVTGIEAMAKALHPEMQVRSKAVAAMIHIGEMNRQSRSASLAS